MERVEVKDVRVPEQLQRAMAAEAEAAREARAKVIAAEGEHRASRALKHAAEVIVDSPAALQVRNIQYVKISKDLSQLRYLQTLNSISAENNSTVIFPVPIDIMNQLMSNFRQPQNPQQYPQYLPPQQHQQQSQGYHKPLLKKAPAPVHQQTKLSSKSMKRQKASKTRFKKNVREGGNMWNFL